MARIKTYAIDALPTLDDKVIGTNVDNSSLTMNYKIGDIIALVPGGGSSVQSLNTLTGVLNLVGAGGISISTSGDDIIITGSGGSSGLTSINTTATGPNVNIEGKGGLVVTEVGNTIFLDTTGVGGGGLTSINTTATGPNVNIEGKGGLVVTEVGNTIFLDTTGVGDFTLTTTGTSGAATLVGGVLNIPQYSGGGGSGITSINTTATGPNVNFEGKGGIIVTEVGNTVFIDDSGTDEDVKFKIDASDTQAGYWADKVFPGGGITKTTSTDAQGVKTVQLNQSLPSIVNSIKVGSSIAIGTFEFTGSGVTMTTGTPNVIDFAGGGASLPYTTYVARFNTIGTSVSVNELENTTGGTFTWQRVTGLSGENIIIRYSGVLTNDTLVLCNGTAGDKNSRQQVFYKSQDGNQTITLDILDFNFNPSSADVNDGNFELRIYPK